MAFFFLKNKTTSASQQETEADGIKSEKSVLQEVDEAEAKAEVLESDELTLHIPLLQLIQQLLRNSSTQTTQSILEASKNANRVDACVPEVVHATAPSLDLLLQLQRQLVAKVYALETNLETSIASKPGAHPLHLHP